VRHLPFILGSARSDPRSRPYTRGAPRPHRPGRSFRGSARAFYRQAAAEGGTADGRRLGIADRAALGWYIDFPRRIVAGIMAFGAGVLNSALSFELMDEAQGAGGIVPVAMGFLICAVAFTGFLTAFGFSKLAG